MAVPGYRDIPTETWDPSASLDLAEAEHFLRLCYAESPGLGDVEARIRAVRAEVAATGLYIHTGPELLFGARVAWRNASRCIGRLYWRSLRVLDCRDAFTAEEIFQRIVDHMHLASGGAPEASGRAPAAIRPVISVFPPAVPGRRYARVWNEQLIRYAGYRDGKRTIGDPRYVTFTEAVTRLGWEGKGEAFDVLPLVVETPGDGPCLFELPESAVFEVPLTHPEFEWFADLGLRWHAVPAISHMRLTIGGVHYPLAPFNGWYMGTEIGSRNLADTDRYNLLPVVAQRMGLDMSRESTLWRDRALVELNRAVLWSFERAGAKVTDHHTESQRFLTHIARERQHGREVPADWSWIVPPLSGGATGVFHRYYPEADQRPNFYLDEPARRLAITGRPTEASRAGADGAAIGPVAAAGQAREAAGERPGEADPGLGVDGRAPSPAVPARLPAADGSPSGGPALADVDAGPEISPAAPTALAGPAVPVRPAAPVDSGQTEASEAQVPAQRRRPLSGFGRRRREAGTP